MAHCTIRGTAIYKFKYIFYYLPNLMSVVFTCSAFNVPSAEDQCSCLVTAKVVVVLVCSG